MTLPPENKENYQGILSIGETPGQKNISDEEKDLIKRAKAQAQPVLASVENEGLKNLISHFMEQYGPMFCQEPASAKYHHSYDGGLFDHSYETFELARQVAVLYPSINKDILYTGAFLHDMGKMNCYDEKILKSGKRSTAEPFKKSDYSRELDHVGEGMILVQQLSLLSNVSIKDTRHLLHIIASHHGPVRRGWGSLVDPNTNEAHIVHSCDMISSRIK